MWRKFRFSLRTLLAAIAIVACAGGYAARTWAQVRYRQQRLRTAEEHSAYVILERGRTYRSLKEPREGAIYEAFDGWQEGASSPAIDYLASTPADRRTSPLQRWLGDLPVRNIFMTRQDGFARFRAAFPEAQIVVMPSVAARARQFRAAGRPIDNLFLNVENP